MGFSRLTGGGNDEFREDFLGQATPQEAYSPQYTTILTIVKKFLVLRACLDARALPMAPSLARVRQCRGCRRLFAYERAAQLDARLQSGAGWGAWNLLDRL